MSTIRDDELLAFLVGEGNDPLRDAEIRTALAAEPTLATRLAALSAGLDEALSAPDQAAGFSATLWERLQPRLDPRRPAHAPWWRAMFAPTGFGPTIAFATLLAVAVGIGFLLGRSTEERAPGAFADDAARRVLAAYVSEHLRATERVLLVASNSPEQDATARDLAAALVDSNRLYAAAANRAGKPQLAAFLRQLEPVLVDLARNEDAAGVVARIRDEDLAFKTRAAAALARRDLAPELRQL